MLLIVWKTSTEVCVIDGLPFQPYTNTTLNKGKINGIGNHYAELEAETILRYPTLLGMPKDTRNFYSCCWSLWLQVVTTRLKIWKMPGGKNPETFRTAHVCFFPQKKVRQNSAFLQVWGTVRDVRSEKRLGGVLEWTVKWLSGEKE